MSNLREQGTVLVEREQEQELVLCSICGNTKPTDEMYGFFRNGLDQGICIVCFLGKQLTEQ